MSGFHDRDEGRFAPNPQARVVPGALAVALSLLASTVTGELASAEAIVCTEFCPPPHNQPPPGGGGVFVSANAGLTDAATRFLQTLSTFSDRNAASPNNNPQGGGADGAPSRYRAWAEGYGMTSRTDLQGDFPGDHRKVWGGVTGVGVTLAPGATVGLSVDQSRTKIDVTGLPQHGKIDLTQIGLLGAFASGPWQLSTMAIYGFGRVHTEREDFGGTPTASYDAHLWAGMAEFSYYVALPNNSRFVPKLTFDGTSAHTDGFVESGGAVPIIGSAVNSSRLRMLIGAEAGHTWLWQRTIMDFLVYGRMVDNLVQNIGTLQVSDPAGGFAPQSLLGIRESTIGADAGATLSAKFTETARIYAVYDGRYRSNFISHTGTVGAEIRF